MASTTQISIIIPAYNEETRIAPTLKSVSEHLKRVFMSYEIIVVDDGSTDKTTDIVKEMQKNTDKNITLIKFNKNYGKGAAVRYGVLASSADIVLYMDADGSSSITQLTRLIRELEKGYDIIIGSRAIKDPSTTLIANPLRVLIGRIFATLVCWLLLPNIRDTQCGFKLFTREAADKIFTLQTLNGFSFDVEVLALARELNMTVKEVAISWSNVKGSKVNMLVDPAKMLMDIFVIKNRVKRAALLMKRVNPNIY